MSQKVLGNSLVSDALTFKGVQGFMKITSTPQPVRVNQEANATRKICTVYNNSKKPIYWGLNEEVTSATGTPILPATLMTFAISTDADIWLVGTGSHNVRITEGL